MACQRSKPPKRRKFDDFRTARAGAGQWTVYAMSKPSSSASFSATAKASTRRLRPVEETNAQANAAKWQEWQETQWRREERENAGARQRTTENHRTDRYARDPGACRQAEERRLLHRRCRC